MAFALAACSGGQPRAGVQALTNVRPIAKIGLIAPFEGLHRRTGYAALAAMRQTIADTPVEGLALLPLALDDSNDPARARRAVEKLLRDPQVKAVIGPLTPALAAASRDLLDDAGRIWLAPYAVNPTGGFADPQEGEAWAAGLIAAVGAAVQQQGAAALVIAGDPAGWPAWDAAAWAAQAGLPVRVIDDDALVVGSLTPQDAIFWRGDAAAAAALLDRLPQAVAGIPIWLGPAGDDPVLTEHAKTDSNLYWLTWSNVHYNEWAASHSPATPSAFLVDQATRAAIETVTGAAPATAAAWQVAMFAIVDGESRTYTP